MSANFYAWLPSLPLNPALESFESDLDAIYELADPPDPRLLDFVAALLVRYPDLDDKGETCWAAGPLRDEVLGGFTNVAVVWTQADEAWSFFQETARTHGLICYDPQADKLYRP
jgi:hypothetical protein